MSSGTGTTQADGSLFQCDDDRTEDLLRRANGSLMKGDDPGGIWIRFPKEVWAELFRRSIDGPNPMQEPKS